jgi:hypothetical protein
MARDGEHFFFFFLFFFLAIWIRKPI